MRESWRARESGKERGEGEKVSVCERGLECV